MLQRLVRKKRCTVHWVYPEIKRCRLSDRGFKRTRVDGFYSILDATGEIGRLTPSCAGGLTFRVWYTRVQENMRGQNSQENLKDRAEG